MSADFTPEKEDYKILTPFKMQVLTNFPYIEADFDALTNYGLLCKVVEYLNNVIANENEVTEQVTSLYNAYVSLQNYVNTYFDNLDLQEEINKKLDEMAEDGSLTNLIKDYVDPIYQTYEETINGEFNDFKDNVNNEISTISDKVNASVTNIPIVVNSTDLMTNTNRIYVNTTNGKWYYYDGDSWEIGGTYQSSGISENSIDYLMFDSTIQNSYLVDFTEITLPEYTEGKAIYDNSGVIGLETSVYFSYYKITLDDYIGKIIKCNGTSYSYWLSIAITDSSDNIIYKKLPVNQEYGLEQTAFIKITSGMKYLYLQANASVNNLRNFVYCNAAYINKIIPNQTYKYYTSPDSIFDYTYGYIDPSNYQDTHSQFKFTHLTGANRNFELYRMTKGYKYKINGFNGSNFNTLGYVITDDNFIVESTSSSYGYNTRFNYEFTATKNGFIAITTSSVDRLKTFVYVYDEELSNTNIYKDLKIGFTGDSICAGDGYEGGYAKILHDNYGLNIQNIAQSGGHIAHDRDDVFVICNSIDDLDNDCDAYIIDGGINDYANNIKFGTISSNYTDAIDDTTFVGALEKTFRSLYTYHYGKKFAFLIVHNVLNYYNEHQGNGKTWKDYREVIYALGAKYGVEIIDIGKNNSMCTYDSNIKSTYTVNNDGLHPNQNGYNKYYINEIVNWINKKFIK